MNGILRVGGKLINLHLSKYQKHQIILPKKHQVTDLIIKYFHENHFHYRTQLLISDKNMDFDKNWNNQR